MVVSWFNEGILLGENQIALPLCPLEISVCSFILLGVYLRQALPQWFVAFDLSPFPFWL